MMHPESTLRYLPNWVLPALSYILAAGTLAIPGGAGYGIWICMAVGITCITNQFNNTINRPFLKTLHPVYFLVIYGFGSVLIQMANGEPLKNYEFLLPFIASPLIFTGMRYIASEDKTVNLFFLGISTTAVAAAGWAIYQALIVQPPMRVYGPLSGKIIAFGNLAVLTAVLSLMALVALPKVAHTSLVRVMAIFGFLAGSVASGLNGSKSGWISLLFILPFLITFVYKQLAPAGRLTLIVGLISTATVVWLHPDSLVKSRLKDAWASTKMIVATGSSGDESLGARLGIWRWAITEGVFIEPTLGLARDEMVTHQKAAVSAASVPGFTSTWDHLHNEYIHTWVTRGILGLLLLLMMLVSIGRYFQIASLDPSVKGLAMTGLVSLSLFMLFGMWDIQFLVNAIRSQFVFCLLFLIAFIEARRNAAQTTSVTTQTYRRTTC